MEIIIKSYMIRDLKLKGLDLIMYAIVSNSAEYLENCESIENDFGYPAEEVKASLQKLVDKKLIKRQEFSSDYVELVIYTKNEEEIKKIEKPITKRFIKPTIAEIKAYCDERKNNVDASRFYDFYEAKGWIVGKTRMKDWKAAVRTWEKNKTKQENKVNKEIRKYRTK